MASVKLTDWKPTDGQILTALAEANVVWRNCNLCLGELRAFYGMLQAVERAFHAKERAAAEQSKLANTMYTATSAGYSGDDDASR